MVSNAPRGREPQPRDARRPTRAPPMGRVRIDVASEMDADPVFSEVEALVFFFWCFGVNPPAI